MPYSDPLLKAVSAGYTYDGEGWTLPGSDLELFAGELLCLIGPNGSGKSTLLKLCAGTLRPTTGKVFLQEKELSALPRVEIAKCIGYLPQDITPDFDFTVEEVVGMGRYSHDSALFGNTDAKGKAVCEEAMNATDVQKSAKRRISNLSGGERKRVFLASALAQEPQALLLDEPTAALDIHHSSQFFRLLRAQAEKGAGVLVVTHDLNLAAQFAHRVILLSNGKMHAGGTPKEVITQEILEDVYGSGIIVAAHPQTGLPTVLPGAEEINR